ncbi:transcriptional repressor LexA [Oryzomonas sagensis]|uniref:LexA repressor n=1 Tax=Oryzomonas sagensis TaxID=2603857 RepID=A0ABQ6TMA9_9BACT|nr:transcriptional repressor LexA [Oryzomonas sagensis]KAB0669046.1 transcriptional repressor LexA [Oryzomonas sagensis]
MIELTDRQQEVLDYITNYQAEHGSSPTLREISACIGTAGTAAAMHHLGALEKKGYIQLRKGSSRGIVLSQAPPATISLPIVGRIRAGMLQPAIEDITGHLAVDRNLVKGEGCYFLKVEGDSMINKGILHGDIAMIRPQQVATNGEVVAVMVDGDATLKQFFKEPDRILLQPANPNYDPIVIRPGEGEVSIVGKMIGLFRSTE